MRKFTLGKIFLFVFILLISFNVKGQEMSQDKIKAIYILNFAKYVEWPNSSSLTEITIGIVGNENIYKELYSQSKNGDLNGVPFRIIYFKKVKSVTKVNVLFVDNKLNDFVPDLLLEAEAQSTLLVTDRYDDLKYVMVNILPLDKGKKRYELNKANLVKANIKATNQLLLHGGTSDDIKLIYTEIEGELKEKQERVEAQTKILDEKIKENENQKIAIKKQQAEIINQKTELNTLIRELKEQKAALDANKVVLEEQQLNMDEQKVAIEEQNADIEEQTKKLEEQKEMARIQHEEIDIKTAEIGEIQVKIESQKKVLLQQDALIQTQKGILIIIIAFSSLLILLAFFIWRSYKVKQKINKQLEEKNIAINQQKEEIVAQSKQLELINGELEKLSIVASKTENAVTIMDAEGNLEWVNTGFTRLYGYTIQLLKNEMGRNLVDLSSNKNIRKILVNCIQNKQTEVYESQNTTRLGTKIWVQTTLTPIMSDDDKLVKLVAIETDINKIKDAEESIKKQNNHILKQAEELRHTNEELEKLSIVASETDNAITIMDGIGNIEWINEGFTRLLGFSLDEHVSISKNIVSEDTPLETKLLIHQCIKDKQTVSYQSKVKTKLGSFLWVQTTLTPIIDKTGAIYKLIAIDADISKQKEAEQEIRKQHEEISQQKETLELQNEEIQAQRDKVEQQNKHIRGSINYALTIQSAMLPINEVIDNFFESFVIYRPKDIVSGDFYWFFHKEETGRMFAAVVDCTGHGVPGAFMSMIGSRILSEVVSENKLIKPSQILEELNIRVKKALKQSQTDNNDGMDVALVCLTRMDNGKTRVVYSGAKRPLFYFRMQDKEMNILKGDRKSIGGSRLKRVNIPFTDQEMFFSKGDMIYLHSDGLIDQNNEERKKYGSTRFIALINQIGKADLEHQENKIVEALEAHQDKEEQRDDISIWGIKL